MSAVIDNSKYNNMKKWLKGWWFKIAVLPYMIANKPECTAALKDTIVFQMWYGDVRKEHINKWLKATGQKTIKAYVKEGTGNGDLRLFYEYPDAEKRKTIKGQLVTIIQK